ncbi:multidrug effflux MFS transporter [Meridianimarinicoccus sp. RP-17]|uniref:multidrug effflux MFS transporter n=1 Tax=Meridianimarinicoccus zhengii TaxID=2056810 RepID=UPI000DAE3F1F|nr:multidrug effflux MFS transporter [Phycocomes zhengii]
MTTTPEIRFLDRSTPPHIVTLVALAGLSAAAMNIFLPSLPSMAVHFDADYRVLQLSVTLYLAVNAVLQIFIGPLSDRLGRRPVLIWAFALFIFFSLAILVAPTVEIFLALRMGQSAVVAGMVLSRAIVRDTVAEAQAASRIGYVTMGMALVPMVSPVIGGLLDQAFGWRANFVALAVMGAGVLALVWADLGETAGKSQTSLRDQMREAPELLISPRFWGYNLCATFASGAFFAYLGGAPYVGAEVFGLSPAALGLWFGAPAVGYMAGNAISGAFSVRIGVNAMILIGACLTVFGMGTALALFYAGFETVPVFFGFMIFVGLGNGMVIPNATAGMLSVRPRLAGTASGLGGALMIGGGAGLSALAAALLVPGAGAYPLIYMMLATACLAVLAIVGVLWREWRLRHRGMR